jgi:hypothetical protein
MFQDPSPSEVPFVVMKKWRNYSCGLGVGGVEIEVVGHVGPNWLVDDLANPSWETDAAPDHKT